MEQIEIQTEKIKMDQLLKWAGIIETGAQAKMFTTEGMVRLNGIVVIERRKQVRPGDILAVEGVGRWLIVRAE